jgi:hypothetical protein
MKQESGIELNIVQSNMNGRIWLVWFQLSILKLEDVMRCQENRRCTLCNEEEIYTKYKETQSWKEQFFNDKWLYINEETTHKRVISCTKITKLKYLGRFLCKLICKWKNHVKKMVQGFE